jgi:hypothetical protein
MKNLLFSLTLLASLAAQASTVAEDVLESLVAKATAITLTDAKGKALSSENQLPKLISTALLQSYLNLNGEKGGLLSTTVVDCEETAHRAGGTAYLCEVMIQNGSFKRGRGTLSGPETESAIMFRVEATKFSLPGAKAKITSAKAIAEFAG